MFITDSRTKLSIDQQVEELEEQKAFLKQPRVKEFVKVLTTGKDSFTRLSNKFLHDNAKTIYQLGPAWNLYTFILSYTNHSEKEGTYAGLDQWLRADFVVFCQSQRYIGEKLGISGEAVGQQLKKLERLGWIRRVPNYYFGNGHFKADVIIVGHQIKLRNETVGVLLFSHLC